MGKRTDRLADKVLTERSAKAIEKGLKRTERALEWLAGDDPGKGRSSR